MLSVQSTCSLDRWREHGVQTNNRWVDFIDEINDLAVVCKVLFLVPRCNEDLDVFRECFDTLGAWRLDGTDLAIFVRCEVVVVVESFMEGSAIELMEDNIFRQRLVLLRECRDPRNSLC